MNDLAQSIKNQGVNALINIDENALPQDIAEIKEIAKQASNGICGRFENLGEMQVQMRELSEKAANAETDLRNRFTFGILGKNKTEKRVDILTEKSFLQDKHNDELLKLQRTSIAFSLLSARLGGAMINEMQKCIKKGFEDTDGRIKRLSENSKIQARLMIQDIKKQQSNKGWIMWLLLGFVIVACGAYFVVKFAL